MCQWEKPWHILVHEQKFEHITSKTTDRHKFNEDRKLDKNNTQAVETAVIKHGKLYISDNVS
jgi:hypothetical protein